MKTLAVLNTSSTLQSIAGQESLDLVMALASFGQSVSVFFIDDGVFQLVKQQQPTLVEQKHYSKGISALEFYDVEHLYVCETSLSTRQLTADDLLAGVTIVSATRLNELLQQASSVVRL